MTQGRPGDQGSTSALFGTAAVALARTHFEIPDGEAQPFPDGALVVGDDRVVIYRHQNAAGALGPAMIAATKHRAAAGADLAVSLLVAEADAAAGAVLARQAAALDPAPEVHKVVGADLEPMPAAEFADPIEPLEADMGFVADLEAEGLEAVVEAGILRGELLGLEIARAVDGDLEVGVGRFDREAGTMLRGTTTPTNALKAAIDEVLPHRSVGARPHPLNRLCRERWLRSMILHEPTLLGLASAVAVETVEARDNLVDPCGAAALGADEQGQSVLVVCSAGVDTGLLGTVADLVGRHEPQAVVIALPERDLFPTLINSLTSLRVPTTVRGLAAPWPR